MRVLPDSESNGGFNTWCSMWSQETMCLPIEEMMNATSQDPSFIQQGLLHWRSHRFTKYSPLSGYI